ncbi:hypothetical protein [Thermocatellispora tengchongensis]|uniref:hypothetical protein n=1 Tax=Thermocatellispora tengchongensis TaxID=1073253 RepID=UPI0036446A70
MVDRVLRCPSARYTVVAPASDPLGLAQVVLGVARGFGADPWTFATRESDDAGREATRLIILTAEPEFSSHGVPRERIAPAGAPAAPLAETLVAAYLRSGSEGMERIRPSRPLTDPARVRRWAKAVQRAPGVLDDAFLLATAAARGRLSPRERDYLASAEGRGQVAAMIARFPDAELVELVRLWAEGRTDPVTEAVSAELERRLARAGGRRSRGVLARWRHAIPVLVAVVVLAVAAGFVLFATARLWR